MSEFVLRILLVAPWVFIVWLIGQGFAGEIDGLLTFVLVLILIPIAAVLNLISVVLVRGRKLLKEVHNMNSQQSAQKKTDRISAVNYADLAWYDPRRWTRK